ncbi:MAG TPA: DNA recombination protein RmuC [Prolixibacteraceae bacterium]|nr:DNA recombination protein RmuC [Prolixibacteraceae bacterium]
MDILFLSAGLALGILLGFLFLKGKLQKQRSDFELEKLSGEQILIQQKFELDKEKSLFEDRNQTLLKEKEELIQQIQALRTENSFQNQQLARAEGDFLNLQEKLDTQKKEMENIQQKFTTEFESIAAKILKQNTTEFSATNQKSITELLSPLKEKIQVFEKKVEDTYEKGLKDQTDLKAELKKLHDLNLKISDEANNLTRALKGDVKKQGNWGEMILERILERSGLTEGREYMKQESVLSENGQRFQPDVVIHLPDQKHIVIDSKVSLVAYERLVNSDNETNRLGFVKEHLQSVRNHIKILSEKHYQHSPNFNSPDFVLLFIPIESSFSIAVQEDQDLFSYAWDSKVVIVSPSTLLATLRTIASIWQQENQNRNALEIARQSGALYDKFVSFIDDMESIGKSLESTRKTYDQATNKLYSGSGNLVRRAENIRKLGAKTTKELPLEKLTE